MRYRLLRQIPTNRGRSVYLAETPSGDRVLVKRAHTEAWAADLRDQARHFMVMGELLGERSIYPAVLEHSDDSLVLPFYEHGSLDELSRGPSRCIVRVLTRDALSHVFMIAGFRPPADSPLPQVARDYLAHAARARLGRLDRAVSGPEGCDWSRTSAAGQPPRIHEIEESVAWIRDEAFLARSCELGPTRLVPAAHGDFGLNNVMLAEKPAAGARLVFIDTRGIWCDGYPWWDPIMDLATVIAFHCRIEPALARAGELPGDMADAAARLREADILRLITGDAAFVAWAGSDEHWRKRLEVEIAIRLLGNIGVQLTTAPRNPGLRAAVVLGLYVRQARRVVGLLNGHG